MDKEKKTLGILGGMGPAATAHFYSMITDHTSAVCDSDHLNIIITSSADIPDRTDYILGKSQENPLHMMLRDAETLRRAGASVIAVPCNTAQYFWRELSAGVHVPILDIVYETSLHVARRGFKNAALLATEGTIMAGSYSRALSELGVICTTPDKDTQSLVTSIIYDHVKANKPGGGELFRRVSDRMFDIGCDCLILGCTELPLVSPPDPRTVDSLEVLAYRSIVEVGGTPTGFSPRFLMAYEE